MTQPLATRPHFAPRPIPARRVDVILIGPRGQVGTALRTVLAAQQARLRDENGIDLRLLAAADRHGLAFDLQGLAPAALDFERGDNHDETLRGLFAAIGRNAQPPCVLIDCTASAEVAAHYGHWLSAGVGVVTPNKHANSGRLDHYRALQATARRHGAPWRYETTVGAAIPVLGPLSDIRQRGERVTRLRGVLSGSLSFLLDRLHAGERFSAALAEAQARGYTEPDPNEDLRAHDLARKAIILAREAGLAIEPQDVAVTPFVTAIAHGDAEWTSALAATPTGQRWVMLVDIDHRGARVSPQLLPVDSPFARLRAGENLLCVETDWQAERPLWLGGAGAGPQITAAGVFSDLVAAAQQLAARH